MNMEISLATPGKREWRPCNNFDPPGWSNSYSAIKSTFPSYCKFFYEKKPKNWHYMTTEEQEGYGPVFAGNKKEILSTMKKLLHTGKRLTERQLEFMTIMYNNFIRYELDWFEQYDEELIDEVPF